MLKEKGFSYLYKRFRSLSKDKVLEELGKMDSEMKPFGERLGSEGFIILNDSLNNLKHSVLNQILEEKS